LLLEIKKFPDKILRNISKPVEKVDKDILKLIDDMFETMYAAPGIGLAAPQVGILKRVVVIDITGGENKEEQIAFINPEIIEMWGEEEGEEGCLSIPGEFEIVKRASNIKIKYLDKDGKTVELETEGLLARAIQHEIDHLDGKLFIDKLSPIRKEMVKKKIKKRIAANDY
jgi:peptide deformylase